MSPPEFDTRRTVKASPSMPNLKNTVHINYREHKLPSSNSNNNLKTMIKQANGSNSQIFHDRPPPDLLKNPNLAPPSKDNPNHLSTPPKSNRRDLLTHSPDIHNSESGYSFNLSVIDMYGESSPTNSSNKSPAFNLNEMDDFSFQNDTQQPNSFNSNNVNVNSSNLHILTTSDLPSYSNETENGGLGSPIMPGGRNESKSTFDSSRNSNTVIRNSIQENTPATIDELLQSDTDRYGFKKQSTFVSKQEYNEWFSEYSTYLIRRKKKWELFMKNNGLNYENDQPKRFPPKSDKLKKYIRKGIPAEWRGDAWFYYAKGYEKLNANPGVYDKIVADTINIKNKDTEIIERDLNRTFPDNIYFRTDQMTEDLKKTGGSSALSLENETPLIQSLRRVLVAFANYQPHIGYCQSLNFLAGLLLIFMDEEKAFWMLLIITQKYLPGVHDVNLEGVNIDQGVLMLCTQEYLPGMWDKIGRNFEGDKLSDDNVLLRLPPITLCTASWFMSGFIGILPIETVLRVWDCIFYEESKTLFRISLTIFKLCEPELIKFHDQMEIFQFVQNYPKSLINPTLLFDACFKKRNGFGSLSQDEINRCRKFVSDQRKKISLQQKNAAAPITSGFDFDTLATDHHEIYGFKKGLPGVHWNKTLTNKMRKFKKTVKV